MPESTPPPADAGTGTPAAAAAGAAVTPDPKPAEPKKLDFTQEQLDKIIADRVARAVPSDYAELQALKVAADAAEESQKTELQKAKDAAAKSKEAGEAAIARANGIIRQAAILSEAATQKAHSEAVVAILASSADITVDKDGSVQGAKEAVEKLLKDNPYLLVIPTPGQSGGQFGGNDSGGKTIDEQIAELEKKNTPQNQRDIIRLKLLKATSKTT